MTHSDDRFTYLLFDFPSIPARHQVWRRVSANWLAGLVLHGLITETVAGDMRDDLTCGLARKAYRLETRP